MNNLPSKEGFTAKEEEAFAGEVGELVFQSALLQFLATLDEEASKGLEDFVEANGGDEDFMEKLFALYPEFEDVLKLEMLTISEEAKEIIPE